MPISFSHQKSGCVNLAHSIFCTEVVLVRYGTDLETDQHGMKPEKQGLKKFIYSLIEIAFSFLQLSSNPLILKALWW